MVLLPTRFSMRLYHLPLLILSMKQVLDLVCTAFSEQFKSTDLAIT